MSTNMVKVSVEEDVEQQVFNEEDKNVLEPVLGENSCFTLTSAIARSILLSPPTDSIEIINNTKICVSISTLRDYSRVSHTLMPGKAITMNSDNCKWIVNRPKNVASDFGEIDQNGHTFFFDSDFVLTYDIVKSVFSICMKRMPTYSIAFINNIAIDVRIETSLNGELVSRVVMPNKTIIIQSDNCRWSVDKSNYDESFNHEEVSENGHTFTVCSVFVLKYEYEGFASDVTISVKK
jgi:hypothetical protein